MAKVHKLALNSNAIVWDYSQRGVEEWLLAGVSGVHHLPLGYTPNLTRIPHAEPAWDVAFFGWLTPRRVSLIDELRKYGLNVYSSAACYGGGRDNIISRSKLCLNVHHDGRDRFEAVRVSYLMANGKCVVSESSSDDDEYQDLRGLTVVPYRLLVDSCRSLCATSAAAERMRLEEQSMASIQRRDFTAAVAAALDASSPSKSASTPAPIPESSFLRRASHAMERVTRKRDYLAEARSIGSVDPRVAARYKSAMSSGDMKDFVAWMAGVAHGNILEIGVRDGASTSAFLFGLHQNGGHLYSIDVQSCGHLFEGHPSWTFIHANSTNRKAIFPLIPYELDILLIDGDHSKAGVMADLEYARLIRPGGMVLFHDIAPERAPDGCSDASWPGDAVRDVYEATCRGMATQGWTHEELPGRYGMGVLRRPAESPATKEATSEVVSSSTSRK
jgi:predicted O-methyltransferase YrrM